jgi:4-hydroxy-tetrahydrodipicolinate synthase
MRGVFTALVTPFNQQNELDLQAFKRILEDQRDAGVAGVIPCGTTGESPTLSKDEKKKLTLTAIETLKGTGVKVLAGTGTNDTAETVAFSKWASDQGVDGVLVVTPYYNKPSQAGLEAHFRAVAEVVACPVMLYNVPGRTGVSLTAETVTRLAAHPRITSIKEATSNVAFASEIIDQLTQAGLKMTVLSGDDAAYLPLLSLGGQGVVSVSSNLFPRAMVQIQKLMDAGKPNEAAKLHQRFHPLFRDLFIDSNPVPIKHAMAFVGWCDARVRAPLAPLSPENQEKLEHSFRRCGVVKGVKL